MSSTIENRVVQMKFDNKDFESNVRTSMNTLKGLNQSLDKLDGANGFSNLAKSAKGISLDSLASSVETISGRFSALGIVGVTALQNITNSAIEAGKQMIKSLTIDPVKQGFDEYELKMGSVQTIMNSSGESLEVVNGYLGKLNDYADKTIYSFSDMTSSIGKFTNAGVSLDKSVAAIQGISNAAALSGANAEQASHAMYNFAQALSSGSVKLIDWKSIENANMATVEFKQQLLDTALALGTVRKEGDKYVTTTTDMKGKVSEAFDATSMFNDSLSHQWMTSEVLTETLARYADETTDLGKRAFAAAQDVKTFSQLMDTLKEAVGSGWSETFELIFGDFEEAKALWTAVNNEVSAILDAQAKQRNDLLRGWKELGGRNLLGESLRNSWEGFLSVLIPIRDAFRDIFPATTSEQLYKATEALRNLTANFKISDETANNLRRTFRGLFAILDIAKQVFVALYHALRPLLGLLPDVGGGFLGITAAMGDGIYLFDQWLKNSKVLENLASIIAKGLQFLADKLRIILDKMKKMQSPFDENSKLLEALRVIALAAGNAFAFLYKHFSEFATALAQSGTVKEFFIVIGDALGALGKGIAKLGQPIVNFFKRFAEALGEFARTYNTDVFDDLIKGGFLAGFLVIASKLYAVLSSFKEVQKSIVGVLDSVRGCFEAYQQRLKADILLKIAIAIGVLTAAVVALSLIDPNKLAYSTGALSVLFADLVGAMTILSRVAKFDSFKNAASLTVGMTAMIALAAAIVKMAKAMKIIGEMDWDQVKRGLIGISVVTAEMVILTRTISKVEGSVLSGAAGLYLMVMALKKIVDPLVEISKIDTKALIKGLVGMGVLLLELATFFEIADHVDKVGISQGVGILLFAEGMTIIAGAVAKVGTLNFSQMVTALLGMAAALAAIVLVFEELEDTDNIIKTSAAILIAAGALNLMAMAIASLSDISILATAKSLVAFGVAFKMVIGALNQMPEKSLTMGTSLLMIGKALKSVAEAMVIIGGLSLFEIAKGLGAIVISLDAMTAALVILGKAKGDVLKSAASIAIMSAALLLLAPALMMLGTLSIGELIIALVALAGALATIGVVSLALAPAVPFVTALGIGVALLAASFLTAGTAILLFAKGLALIGTTGVKAAAGVAAILTALIATIPLMFKAIAAGIVEFINVIRDSIQGIVAAGVAIVKAFCDGLKETIPYIADTVVTLIDEVLKTVAERIDSIAESLMKILLSILRVLEANIYELTDLLVGILINFINAIGDRMPELVAAAMRLIGRFFTGIIEALKGVDTSSIIEALAGVGLLTGIMVALNAAAALVPGALVGIAGLGLVIAGLTALVAAFGAIAQIPGLDWLIGEGATFLMNIGRAIGGFVGGIVGGVAEGLTASLPKIGENLSQFMEKAKGFFDGARLIDASLFDGVNAMAKSILLLTAADILDGITRWFTGGRSLVHFGEELAAFGPYFKQYAQAVDGIPVQVVSASANAAAALGEMAANLPASGGLAEKIFGERSLSEFGEELVRFAPSIKRYGELVAGLDANAVSASAAAAQVLSDMAAKLPNQGGFVSWFTGDNTLTHFGEELASFGPHIKQYAQDVAGITPESVTASAEAVEILSTMAENLPNQGGVVSWFTGDNTLSQFGKELSKFGPRMADYSNTISSVNPNVVTASASAARALSSLAKELPNQGGLISWFTGDNTLSDFGKNLKKFGKGFADYADSVKKINANQLNKVTAELRKLLSLASSASALDTSGLKTFTKNLKDAAKTGIDSFLKEFKNCHSKVKSAVKGFIDTVNKAAKENEKSFNDSGKKLADSIITGFTKELQSSRQASDAIKKFCSSVVSALENGISASRVSTVGRNLVTNLASGITAQANAASNAAQTIANKIRSKLDDNNYRYENAGINVVNGLINGMYGQIPDLREAAAVIGNRLISALESSLGIESPSKEGARIGKFFDLGIVKGLNNLSNRVTAAAESIGSDMIDTLSSALSGVHDMTDVFDTDPVIKPVMDLSDLEKGARQIDSMLSTDRSVALSGSLSESMDRSKETFFDSAISKIQNAIEKLGSDRPDVTNNFTIVQQPGQSMDEFAEYVSRYITREYENQKVVWGT